MKFCTHCGAEIADDAVVCVKCGCSVGKLLPKSQRNSAVDNTPGSISDALIMVFAGTSILTFIIQMLITNIVPNWYETTKGFYYFLTILRDLSCFLPAFAIKNRTLRIVGIIAVVIPNGYWIYNMIKIIFN
jgi:ribosomal protein L40E